MQLLEVTLSDGRHAIINLDHVERITYEPSEPIVEASLLFKFPGERNLLTLTGAEAERVWTLLCAITI